MGACSTITISRDKAIAYLMQKLLSATNDELEEMLDPFLRERLYNATVRSEGEDDYLLTV